MEILIPFGVCAVYSVMEGRSAVAAAMLPGPWACGVNWEASCVRRDCIEWWIGRCRAENFEDLLYSKIEEESHLHLSCHILLMTLWSFVHF
jgi:hypothetical protein